MAAASDTLNLSDPHPDAEILAAWAAYVPAYRAAFHDPAHELDDDDDAVHESRTSIMLMTPSTPAGLTVQLRLALMISAQDAEVDEAVLAGEPIEEDWLDDEQAWSVWRILSSAEMMAG